MRNRRFAASGGVAASVVAVVVGAVAITGLVGANTGERPGSDLATATEYSLRPTTTGETAPPGPQLPLSVESTAPPSAAPSTSDRHAAELTLVLSQARPVPAAVKVIAVPETLEPLTFLANPGSYLTSADLSDAKGRGSMTVQITYTPGTKPRCANLSPWEIDCAEVAEAGIPMVISTEKQDTGYIAYVVRAVRADGTSVYVNATNAARTAAAKATRPTPPLDPAVLRAIATLPGLTFF
jgi:hypothetical protein